MIWSRHQIRNDNVLGVLHLDKGIDLTKVKSMFYFVFVACTGWALLAFNDFIVEYDFDQFAAVVAKNHLHVAFVFSKWVT